MKIGLLMVSPRAATVLMQGLAAGQDDGSVTTHEALALEYELSKIAGHRAHHAPPVGQSADFIAEMFTSEFLLRENIEQEYKQAQQRGLENWGILEPTPAKRGFMVVWRAKEGHMGSNFPDHYLRIGKRGIRSTHKQERADLFTETEAHELALAHPALKPKGRYYKAIVLRQGDKVGMMAVPKPKQPYMKHLIKRNRKRV